LHKNVVGKGTAKFEISYFKNKGEALDWHNNMNCRYNAETDNKEYSKYMNLSPVSTDTSYVAFLLFKK
jgi:hypothetical protein